MEQVEADLKKSKHAREKQSREFARQLEEEKYKHEHEVAVTLNFTAKTMSFWLTGQSRSEEMV